MAKPVHRRNFDAFLSHAHVDRTFVDELYRWLGDTCGLNIWYDAVRMSGGATIGSGLQNAIEDCRRLLLVGSSDAVSRGWVREEMEIARAELADFEDFRIVPLRLANADVAPLIRGHSWIDLPAGQLDGGAAAQILQAFYPGDSGLDPGTSRDVYVSGSWQSADNVSALAVFRSLRNAGFRLIGDAKDQKGFKTNRVQSIIESCGAFVGVIPYRDGIESASATGKPYKYFLTELDFAINAQIPVVLVADPRIRRVDADDQGWLRMDTLASQCPADIQSAIEDLWDQWVHPPRPHYVFLATELASPNARRNSAIREIIQRVTGMPTVVGNEIHEPDLQSAIMKAIADAVLVIADISAPVEGTFNVDCCIEAGMAIAQDVNIALVAAGKSRSPPFMLRRAGQLSTYASEVEYFGVIHKIVRDYRRRVVNAELSRY